MSLTKTGIDYLDYTWSFYTGCAHTLKECPVADKCWARGMAKRFNQSFEPQLHPEKLLDPLRVKKPSRIGVNFTGDSCGDWVDPEMVLLLKPNDFSPIYATLQWHVFYTIYNFPQHQFFFLTKRPQNYWKWGRFPDNAYCGATVCNNDMLLNAMGSFQFTEANHHWLSIEPIMERIEINAEVLKEVSWVVIGGWSRQSDNKNLKLEWVKEIVEACDKVGIPVWLKDNLNNIPNIHDEKTFCESSYLFDIGADYAFNLRQELPKL